MKRVSEINDFLLPNKSENGNHHTNSPRDANNQNSSFNKSRDESFSRIPNGRTPHQNNPSNRSGALNSHKSNDVGFSLFDNTFISSSMYVMTDDGNQNNRSHLDNTLNDENASSTLLRSNN